MSDVEFLAGLSTFELLSVEIVNGFLGALRSVLLVDSLWIVVANESDLTDGVLHQMEGLDFSELLEHLLDLVFRVFHRDVLDVHVVDELSECSSILWLEFHGNSIIVFGGGLDGLGGGDLIVEADESVSSGRVVRVEGHLQRLDLAHGFELLLEVLVLEVLWDGSDEDVGSSELLFVDTEKLLVELKGSARLASNLEELHGLNSLGELLWVLDADDSRVERSGDVFPNLRFFVKDDSGLFLEGHGDLS